MSKEEIEKACKEGNKLQAVKLYRQEHKGLLRTAKEAVEFYMAHGHWPMGDFNHLQEEANLEAPEKKEVFQHEGPKSTKSGSNSIFLWGVLALLLLIYGLVLLKQQ